MCATHIITKEPWTNVYICGFQSVSLYNLNKDNHGKYNKNGRVYLETKYYYNSLRIERMYEYYWLILNCINTPKVPCLFLKILILIHRLGQIGRPTYKLWFKVKIDSNYLLKCNHNIWSARLNWVVAVMFNWNIEANRIQHHEAVLNLGPTRKSKRIPTFCIPNCLWMYFWNLRQRSKFRLFQKSFFSSSQFASNDHFLVLTFLHAVPIQNRQLFSLSNATF